jgi:RNA polymerase sigma factor (TIGR02999 family)
MNLVYQPLRRLAMNHMRRERLDNSLSATALVHEAYIRLVQPGSLEVDNRSHFMSVASKVMRRILVDHARAHRAKKRWGAGQRVDLAESAVLEPGRSEEMLALDECLRRLGTLDRRQSEIVEMRFFGGMSEQEIAGVFGISERTVRREWGMARAWLHSELTRPSGPAHSSGSNQRHQSGKARRPSLAQGRARIHGED